MVWRKPTEQDHKAVLKRIRMSAIFNCLLLGFGVIACIFGDIFATMYYIKEGYDVPLIVILQTLMIGTTVLLTFLMKDFLCDKVYRKEAKEFSIYFNLYGLAEVHTNQNSNLWTFRLIL